MATMNSTPEPRMLMRLTVANMEYNPRYSSLTWRRTPFYHRHKHRVTRYHHSGSCRLDVNFILFLEPVPHLLIRRHCTAVM